MQQLGGTDAGFLCMETLETPMHVGGLYLYELPERYAGDFHEDFKRHIVERLHRVPMLTRTLLPMPLQIDHPVWDEDDGFDVDYHIRPLRLPRPGRLAKREELVGRPHSNVLDRSRPLWES